MADTVTYLKYKTILGDGGNASKEKGQEKLRNTGRIKGPAIRYKGCDTPENRHWSPAWLTT